METFLGITLLKRLMPHGHCFLWNPLLLLLHAGSDIVIGLAYYLFSFCLGYIVSRRKETPFRLEVVLSILFILFCGSCHLLAAYNVWNSYYYLEGFTKLSTAIVSVAALVVLWQNTPAMIAFPTTAHYKNLLKYYIEREEIFWKSLSLNKTVGVAYVSLEGVFTKASPTFLSIVGWGSLEGKTFQEITSKNLEQDLKLLHKLLIGDINHYKMFKMYRSETGEETLVSLLVTLVKDEKHNPLHFIAQIQKVTETLEVNYG